ncbi:MULTISPECIES: hypothetical protein [unclassified Streptomyces]|nr:MULTISPECIES: hypothetical protein [unclassified Streptomyces]MCX4538903.1 hypothetical protein [Streptomyces sp. NBC_01669]WSA04860.1 hypothetical protein OHA79_45225 [Streptomyces sp. NBC_00841]WSJ91901.1 hypothetical protein OG395_00130 [Streptomyces sp. NBC_01320]WSK01184.1 hypothetical protein OG395_55220 [Streptomyces sp. NBC_01320]
MRRTPGTFDARARHASTPAEVNESLGYVPTHETVQYQLDL